MNQSDQLIVIDQLPIITERLHEIKKQAEEKTEQALSLACTEDNYKEIKKVRTELNNDFESFEERRKGVKKAILEPYNSFEAVYKDCVTNIFNPAIGKLSEKINEVENGLKDAKRAEVESYFNELLLQEKIDFVTFEQTGIVVTMTASKKSLNGQAYAFVQKLKDDLALIETQDHKTEILVEYKKSLNVSAAITQVMARMEAIEAEKARAEERQRIIHEEQASAQKVVEVMESLAPPKIEEPVVEEKVVTVSFKVTHTLSKMKELKAFLIEGGYRYE